MPAMADTRDRCLQQGRMYYTLVMVAKMRHRVLWVTFFLVNVQNVCKVQTPTNVLFIKLDKVLKMYIKNHFDMLLHVSVYDRHQAAFTRA